MKRVLFAIVSALVWVGLISACTTPTPAPTQPPAPTQAPTQAPTAVPTKDTLVIGVTLDPPTLDPFGGQANYQSVYGQICERLIYWDTDDKGNAVIVKQLATDYKWVNDTTLQFKLRQGVTFSNGEPFNAESAKLSLEQFFSAFNYSQWLTGMLKEVQIVDPMTVNVVLTKPAAYLTSVFAMGSFQIPAKDFKTRGAEVYNQSPVCTGPWVFKEHKKDNSITLVANPNYWGGTPKFKTLTFRIIPEDAARVAALEAGEVDLITTVPASAVARLKGNSNVQVITTPILRQVGVFFDVSSPQAVPLKDAKVRLALNYAIDRDAICSKILGGNCMTMDGQYLTKSHNGYNPNLKPYPFDPAKAKQLLAEAGYANGFEMDYWYLTNYKAVGEAVSGYLRAVGLKINEKVTDYTEWARQFDNKQMTALYTLGFLFGQDGYLALISYIPGARFRTSVMPKAFDDAVLKAADTTDDAQRLKLLQEAEKAISDEPFAVYLYSPVDIYAARTWVKGFVPRADQTLLLANMGVTPKTALLPTTAPAQPTAVPPTVAPTKPPAPTAPPMKDTLIVAQSVDPQTLDPFETTVPYVSVFAQICEPLITWDTDANGSPVIKKHLATDYKWLNDTTLQFKLREGIKFSNGEPLDAAAAKLSLEQLFVAFNYSQWLEKMLKEVQIVDPLTVNVVLNKPAGHILSVLARGSMMIAPKDFTTRGREAFIQSPVCTGPWVFKDHKKDDSITLTANPNYWGGTPKFKTITYRIIPDDNARVAALEAGEIDLAVNIPLAAATRIENNSKLKLLSRPSLRQFATFFDTDNPKAKPLQDVRVRLAMNYAVDRAAMCKQLFAGRCTPMDGQFLSKAHYGYNPNLKMYPYDVAKAKDLLKQAGYADGFEAEFTYTVGRYPQDKQAGEAIAGYLRAAGLKITEKPVDYPEWARQFDARPRQTTAFYTVGFLFGEDGYLSLLSYIPGARFRTSIMPPAFDDAIAKAGLATDEAQRLKLLQDAEKAISDEPFAIYLYSIDDLYGLQSWVTGFVPRSDQTLRLTNMGVTPK